MNREGWGQADCQNCQNRVIAKIENRKQSLTPEIGGAMGQHKGGRHIHRSGTTANLLLKTLHMFGIEQDSIGDSTEALSL